MNGDLNEIFKKYNKSFDEFEPNEGHLLRFKEKLSKVKGEKYVSKNYKWLYLAASVIVLLGFFYFHEASSKIDLSDISKNMAEKQNYFTAQIQKDIKFVINNKNQSNKIIINDAFNQLFILRKDYLKLTIALNDSGEDQRVIHAMISNYQKRVIILQNLISRLNDIKNRNNENQTI